MQSGWVEIFFLAMLAGFIGLRLYNVLGRRSGDENPISDELPRPQAESRPYSRPVQPEPDFQAPIILPTDIAMNVRPGLEDIMRADRQFAPEAFVAGAKGAYAMILEAFWKGDLHTLRELASDEMTANFQAALEARAASGDRIENRLLNIDRAQIVGALLNGSMAEVTVRFDASIIAATRDAQGQIIAGDPNATVETHDLWTFSHHVNSPDPAWLLIATDEVE